MLRKGILIFIWLIIFGISASAADEDSTASAADEEKSGLIRTYSDENSYVECLYEDDMPYGYECTWENGEIVSERLLIRGMDKDDLIRSAVSLSGNPVASAGWINQFVKIEGTVAFIYDDDSTCHFRIADAELGYVTGEYRNTTGDGAQQCCLPNMRAGEHVRVYGKLKGYARCKTAADTEAYGWDCLVIDPYYGEIISDTVPSSDRASYAALRRDPYQVYGKAVNGYFAVKQCLRKGNTSYLWAVPDDRENAAYGQYVLICDDDTGMVAIAGDTVYIEGFYAGQVRTIRGTGAEEDPPEEDPDDAAEEDPEEVPEDMESIKMYDMFPAIRVDRTGEDRTAAEGR